MAYAIVQNPNSTGVNGVQTLVQAQSGALETVEIAGPGAGISYCKKFLLEVVADDVTPAAQEFTAAASDICTKVGHGLLTGLKVRVSTTTTLPGGLAAATDYFVIKLTADTFKLAANLIDANAGTAINIADAGTGVHTITPTALAGASYKVQIAASAAGPWYDLSGVTNNITVDAGFVHEKVDPAFPFARVYLTLTAGQVSLAQTFLLTGE